MPVLIVTPPSPSALIPVDLFRVTVPKLIVSSPEYPFGVVPENISSPDPAFVIAVAPEIAPEIVVDAFVKSLGDNPESNLERILALPK